ncbi:MAG: hypothetical protein OEO77_06170, partial [Acidimicrobiia bacterium]|nr:hypothetical protein [Acidimicrobiia bacterium]
TTNNSYPYTQTTEIPDVPGGLKSQATFTFLIDDGFTLAGAELILGDPTQNQARVSLDGTTGAVRLEPTEPPVSGMLTMELIDLAFTRATVRYDLPDRHREVQQGKQALTLYFDAVSRKGGNWQVFATDFALILPDGTAIGPEAIDIGSLPGSAAGVATPDRYVQFLVDEDPGGDYTLRLTPGTWFIGDDGVTEATFEFSLP